MMNIAPLQADTVLKADNTVLKANNAALKARHLNSSRDERSTYSRELEIPRAVPSRRPTHAAAAAIAG